MKPLCVVPEDVQRITGKGERYSREVIRKIKLLNNKASHQLVTIHELSTYLGLEEKDVESRLC
ncbi:hypothetical protein [Flavobacterium sp. 3HN19-14]|uniref:hypothetical protein n=1 Tax=Flavobacterium sp. 3HN19-14 TaxID=3448133 RepID=UPI003EDF1D1B